MNWVPFYQILFGSLYVAGKLPTYPSPEPTWTLTSHSWIVTICLCFFLPLFLKTEKARRQSTFSEKGRLTLVPLCKGSLSPSSFFSFFFFLFSFLLAVFHIGLLFFNQNLWSWISFTHSFTALMRWCDFQFFSKKYYFFPQWWGRKFGVAYNCDHLGFLACS